MNKITLTALSLALTTTLGLSACTKKKDSDAKASPTPAADSILTQKKLFQKAAAKDTPYRLYQIFSENPKNVNFSPLSLNMAFGEVYLGAEGSSKSLLEQIFGFKDGGFSFDSEFKLAKDLKAAPKDQSVPQIYFANSVWVTKAEIPSILFSYKQDLAKYFDSSISPIDVKKINAWVSENTQGKIPGIVDKIDKKVLSLFVNALYMKADWVKPFKKEATHIDAFRTSIHSMSRIDMMTQINTFKYFETELAQWVALPYQGAPLEMILGLPKKEGDLKAFEEKFDSPMMEKVFAGLKEEKVDLTLPKFKLSTRVSLKKTFEDAGYEEVFKPGNFTRFSKNPNQLKISEVIQATTLEVDEKGTEAAAATAIAMTEGAAMGFGAKTFNANHPFIFMIRNSKTGEIYFLGRVYNPLEN
jgi:serpin B